MQWSRALLCSIALLIAGAPASVRAESTSEKNLGKLADEFFWELQSRKLRPNLSARGNAKWVAEINAFSRRLDRIKRSRLSGEAAITRTMLKDALAAEARYVVDGWIQRDLGSMESLLLTVHSAVEATERRTVSDWRSVISTLRYSEHFAVNYIALLKEGIDNRRMQPKDVVRSSIEQAALLSSRSSARNPLLALEAEMSEALRGNPRLPELKKELRRALAEKALPAHAKLKRFLSTTYLSAAPRRPGSDPAAYQHYVETHLGPGYKPAKLATWGAKEVDRIYRELERTARSIDPKMKSLPSFMRKLDARRSEAFGSGDELLARTRAEVSKAVKLAGKVVRVPRAKLTVESIPVTDEKTEDAQYINHGPNRGTFQINTTELLGSTLAHQLPSVVTHEHGHHIQGVIAQRNERLPEFRRSAAITVYDEGWAMYIDHLRKTGGNYSAVEKIGHLRLALWAAAQMVVDVGLHTGTMSVRDAHRTMARALFSSSAEAAGEVERLLNLPGHALSYYVGRAEMLRLRRKAKRHLGARFNEKAFHEMLLASGAMPMNLLKARVGSWMVRSAAQKKSRARLRDGRRKGGRRAPPRPRASRVRTRAR